MRLRPSLFLTQLSCIGMACFFAYSCGKDDDSGDDGASSAQVSQAATGYSAFLNVIDYSANLLVANQQALRTAAQVALQQRRLLQDDADECQTFRSNFCESKTSSRAGLLSECETSCEDGKNPTTTCTISENIQSTCVATESTAIVIRKDSTINVESSCAEAGEDYELDANVSFDALISGDGIEGTVNLVCEFATTVELPGEAVVIAGFDDCDTFSCSIDGKGVSCEAFQTAIKESACAD